MASDVSPRCQAPGQPAAHPQTIPHPAPWPYWHCACGWQDICLGEASFLYGGYVCRVNPCPVCGCWPVLQADSLEAAQH